MQVDGYHGTTASAADDIFRTGSFRLSVNRGDWLGDGAYFWQDAPLRAWAWAKEVARRRGDRPAVVHAGIDLSNCLDLTDLRFVALIRLAYLRYIKLCMEAGQPSDAQSPSVLFRRPNDRSIGSLEEPWYPKHPKLKFGRNGLDRSVVNMAAKVYEDHHGTAPWSVRGSFTEGYPVHCSSYVHSRSHVQIAVRSGVDCLTPQSVMREPDFDGSEEEIRRVHSQVDQGKQALSALNWVSDDQPDQLYSADLAMARSRDLSLSDAEKKRVVDDFEDAVRAMTVGREAAFAKAILISLRAFLSVS